MIKDDTLMRVLEYIRNYSDENGFPPTVRDMCHDLGIKSTATAYDYVNRLRERGYLQKADKKKRAVAVRNPNGVRAPLLGTVTAGQPIFAVENYEGVCSFPFGGHAGSELFLLNVKGESMIEAGIYDGDKVIVCKQETAENGDIVVAMFDDGIEEGATVKRYFFRDGHVILHPENAMLSDFVLDETNNVRILGKVVGLVRMF